MQTCQKPNHDANVVIQRMRRLLQMAILCIRMLVLTELSK